MRRSRTSVLALLGLAVLSLSAYAGGDREQGALDQVNFAVIFPGSIQDADYNTIGYTAMQTIAGEFGFRAAFSERVAVPDAERVLREYATSGFDIIWVHGSQFNGAALTVGPDYPDVTFIIEVDSEPEEMLANFWYLDRNFYSGFYVLGSIAAMVTQTGRVGYFTGVQLPFATEEINAILQAFRSMGSRATLEYLFIGDFNDTVRTRQAAESFIAQGIDVIISSVNLGNYGLFNAVIDADMPVFFMTKYTSKEVHAPDNYLTSDLFDFEPPLREVMQAFLAGQRGGYLKLEFGEGKARWLDFPIRNVSPEINERAMQIAQDVASGVAIVERNQREIVR
ncbi:MAG: BMP family ABC transporter substrate-binding protein [Spirochaetaceae bacterium]|nr:MAG: BMP family ABC transporter substrate-binding protein [Spirochaetaceae bacterium]